MLYFLTHIKAWRSQISGQRIFSESVIGFLLGAQSTIKTITIALIIFNGPLILYFPLGVKVALISSVIIKIIMNLFSSSPLVMAGVQEIYAIIGSLIITSIYNKILLNFPETNPLPTILIALALLTIIFGIWIYFLGQKKLGYLVQFIPYPVLSGFLAATGWLLIASGFTMIASSLSFNHLIDLFQSSSFWTAIASLFYATLIYIFNQKYRSPSLLLGMIFFALLLFYTIVFMQNLSFDQLRKMHFIFSNKEDANPMISLPHWHEFYNVQWKILFSNLDQYVIFIVVASITLLLNMNAFELITHEELNINKDLKLVGKANIILGFFGGYVGYISLSPSVINASFGSKTRLPAYVASFISFLALFFSSTLLNYIPLFIFGILIIYIGLDLLLQWLIFSKKRFSWADYSVLLLIFFSIIIFNLLTGFFIGLIASIALFTIQYSQLKVIKATFSGDNPLRSNVEHGPKENYILEKHAHEVYIVILQGYLYFGNMHSLLLEIKKAIHDSKSLLIEINRNEIIKFIIIDCKAVIGFDSSSILGFIKLIQLANAHQIEILFTHGIALFRQQLKQGIKNHNFLLNYHHFNTLDFGLEWVENKIISLEKKSQDIDVHNIPPDEIQKLMFEIQKAGSFLKRKTFKPKEVICHENEQSEGFYYIESGSIDIIHKKRRLRRMLPGIIVGEIGMYLNVPRTATICANQPCVLLHMSRKELEALEEQRADLANELHKQIIKILSKKLIYSNSLIDKTNPKEL